MSGGASQEAEPTAGSPPEAHTSSVHGSRDQENGGGTGGAKLDYYSHEVVFKANERSERERAYQSTLASYNESSNTWEAHRERIHRILGKFVDREKETISKKEWRFIKDLCRRGIPFSERPRAWFVLCGAAEEKRKSPVTYSALLAKVAKDLDEKVARQIEGDINRTFPAHEVFQSPKGTEVLKNVLSVFALVHPDVGYAQGLNFVAGMLILVCGCKAEDDIFWMLTAIVQKRMYPNTYGEDLKGCHVGQKIFDRLVQNKFPKVFKHFESLGCELSLVTSEWLLCLFSRSFPSETVARIWDSLLFEGFKIFYRVSLGFIRLLHDKILQCDNLGDLITFMKEEVRSCVNNEQVMRRAFHGIGSMRSKVIIKYAIRYESEVEAMLDLYAQKKRERRSQGKDDGENDQSDDVM
ncbi:Rab-GTPase-TBC domain-containing protein [Chloropicon primus]|uniref:Rab-GTPase-TBC domain-containing protein n=1 Tax=Chloropicon primus TaxID=1764295 RepID=A0A5B8MIC9_9CHLO|nr:Rab-GTPase-TBC domain-containing protein [Chloropicon primus]UPQ98338.1 Rab-GTPase-TBC domain-containing protein [Chloropicon primus]|eukprot:QDZ19130.1 Rab-GTPase-TBC domain-containing protein [Chloropicon primus]